LKNHLNVKIRPKFHIVGGIRDSIISNDSEIVQKNNEDFKVFLLGEGTKISL
jgi:hypothetical protein